MSRAKVAAGTERRPYEGWARLFLLDLVRWQLRRASARIGRVFNSKVAR